MNQLSQKERARILGALVEGMSIRATSRMFGVSKTTVAKLIRDVGAACEDFQREWFTELTCKDIQLDEIWSFVYGKQKNLPAHLKSSMEHGTVWTFIAICRDCKLIPTYYAGRKSLIEVEDVIGELRRKIPQKFQLSTDAFETYSSGVVRHFDSDQIDYGRIEKNYTGQGDPKRPDARYSPGRLVVTKKERLVGHPDEKKICTSHVERANLTVRMGNRRFTRLTNGHSKKLEMHRYALAIQFAHYNLVRRHSTLGKTPAMAAGITDHQWKLEDLLTLDMWTVTKSAATR